MCGAVFTTDRARVQAWRTLRGVHCRVAGNKTPVHSQCRLYLCKAINPARRNPPRLCTFRIKVLSLLVERKRWGREGATRKRCQSDASPRIYLFMLAKSRQQYAQYRLASAQDTA
jgi:hypothetical protein